MTEDMLQKKEHYSISKSTIKFGRISCFNAKTSAIWRPAHLSIILRTLFALPIFFLKFLVTDHEFYIMQELNFIFRRTVFSRLNFKSVNLWEVPRNGATSDEATRIMKKNSHPFQFIHLLLDTSFSAR